MSDNTKTFNEPFVVTPIAYVVHNKYESLEAVENLIVRIEDDGGGEYVTISQTKEVGNEPSISITPEEWSALQDAVNLAMYRISELEKGRQK